MFERNKLVPELMVTNLDSSLAFWVSRLGFKVSAYQRPEMDLHARFNGAGGVEQVDSRGQWLTALLTKPFGRGINLQIDDVEAVAPIIQKT